MLNLLNMKQGDKNILIKGNIFIICNIYTNNPVSDVQVFNNQDRDYSLKA